MAITTAEQLKQDRDDFADQFNAEDQKKTEQTDDQAFGLDGGVGEGEGAGAGTGSGDGAAAGGEGEGASAEAATQADAGKSEEQANALSDQEKALREREAQLAARELELKAKEAALATSGTGEHQTSSSGDSAGDGKGDGKGTGEGDVDDVEKLLAEDFGADFVDLMKCLIKKTIGTSVTEGLSPLQELVQSVIRDLQTERDTNHFKAIAKAHADFNDIVESTAFQEWLAAQEGDEKAKLTRVVESGSSDEIIDMLTKFKESQKAQAAAGATGGDETGTGHTNDDEIDAAEGVRSSGLALPTEPPADDDYAKAWAES